MCSHWRIVTVKLLNSYDVFYIQECIHEINIHLRTDKKTEYRLPFQVGASAVGQGKTFKDPDMGTEHKRDDDPEMAGKESHHLL